MLDAVRDPKPRLSLPCSGETIVEIAAQAQVQRPVSFCDVVAHVQSKFFHVGVAIEVVRRSTAGQVVWSQDRIVIRVKRDVRRIQVGRNIWLVRTSAQRGISDPRRGRRNIWKWVHRGQGRGSDAGCVVGRIDDPDGVVFIEERLLVDDSCLDLVDPLDVGKIGSKPSIGERAVLTYRLSLQAGWPEVRERVATGVVVVVVAAYERAQSKYGVRIQHMGPGRGNVEGPDLGALIRRSDDISVRVSAGKGCHLRFNPIQPTPRSRVFGIEVIRRLEPASAVAEVQVNRIGG